MGRIIGIDFGKKRTGLAWTDPLRIIATGIGSFDTEKVMDELKSRFENEEVDRIILGYPTKPDGSDTDSTELVRNFKNRLAKQFPDQEIIFWDERYSSREARREMAIGGVKKKKREQTPCE